MTLTHRVGIHLRPGLPAPGAPTPRSIGEPAVNDWLADRLPDLDQIACRVAWKDPVDGSAQGITVTMRDLALQPLDLVEVLRADDPSALRELDARALSHALSVAAPRPDAEMEILHLEHGAAAFSVFEVAAPVGHLRSLLLAARPLRPGDVRLPQEATQRAQQAVVVDVARITTVKARSDTLQGDVVAYLATLQPLLDDQPARRAEVIAGIDGFLDGAVSLLERAARFAVGQSDLGSPARLAPRPLRRARRAAARAGQALRRCPRRLRPGAGRLRQPSGAHAGRRPLRRAAARREPAVDGAVAAAGHARPAARGARHPGRGLRGQAQGSSTTSPKAPSPRSPACTPPPRRCCRCRPSTPSRSPSTSSRTRSSPSPPGWPARRAGCATSSSAAATWPRPR